MLAEGHGNQQDKRHRGIIKYQHCNRLNSKISKGNGALIGWKRRAEERQKQEIVKKLELEFKMEKEEKYVWSVY